MKDLKKWFAVLSALLLLLCAVHAMADADPVKITLADGASACGSDQVVIDGDTVTIKAAGEYELSGELTGGTVVVAVDGTDDVRLYLNGVDITCADGPAIEVKQCGGRVSLYTMYGADNRLASVKTETGTVYAVSDITITGTGTLAIVSESKDGVKTDKGLRVKGGKLTVDAARHGLSGKKKVEIMDGEITVHAGRDGIKSNGSKETKGNIEITGGDLTVTAGDSPISYTHTLSITGGRVNTGKTGTKDKDD